MTSASALARLATGVLLVLAAGCAGAPGSGAAPDTLRWAMGNTPSSLDIAHGFNDASTTVQFAVLDTMVAIGPDGRVVPRIAASWTHPDPRTYVFTLREGPRFSDGTPVTAEDAAYSLTRHLDPAVTSQAASYVTQVKKVEVTGPRTVKVTLRKPSPTFLATAALAWQIVPKKLAAAHPKDLGSPEVGTLGSGPFKVTKFSLASGVTLERNELYWGPKPALRRIEVKAISDPETLRLAVSSGEVDGTNDIQVSETRKWSALPGVTTVFYPADHIAYLSLGVREGPLKDVHVRRAIAHALDRGALATLMIGGHGGIADLMLPKPQITALYGGTPPKLPTYPYDVNAAKAELAESAYPQGFTLAAPYDSGSDDVKALQAIAADLAVIGVRLDLQPLPTEQYRQRMFSHQDTPLQLVDLIYGTPDPGEVLPDLVSRASAGPQGFNFSGYGSPEMDARLDDLGKHEGADRAAAVTEVLAEIADQVPYVPLYSREAAVALRDRFTGRFGTWTADVFSGIRPAAGA
ncbi:ABC transporter substrate-binding protein [Sphaerisporangium fuscum]|uniref:ABC transporter substrate-binding protein n=1 Tax=Sphaerisporangium fuscum TaxID=2835868 RepID=UPI001BDC929F|nr:ABC transporter substrate-binding protein [Sphaerisporangium fuscum]